MAPPKMPVGSHTFIDTFARCPKQAFHRYVAKDQPFVESEEMKWGNLVHAALEKRVGFDRVPLPGTMQAYESFAATLDPHPSKSVELKMGMTCKGIATGFFDKDVWFRGKADVVIDEHVPRDEMTTAFLVDWKTGKKREDPSELEEHALLLKVQTPSLESIKGCYVWLKTGELGKTHDLSHFSVTFERVTRYMSQAEKLLAEGIEWPARENPLCGWCSVKSCKFNPEYAP